jgi:hypothetical protein
MHGKSGETWIADAMRVVTEAGPTTFGFLGHGKCTKLRTAEWIIVTCRAGGRVKELALDEFQMDPAMRTAWMDVKIGRYHHRVDWVARGTPGVGQSVYGGEWGAVGGATAGTDATAKGRVFGKRLSKRCTLCYMAEGFGAAVWSSFAERDMSIERHGDRFVAHLTLRKAI